MAAVMIGADPHKGSHTAVVIDQAETVLGEIRVRASAAQVQRLLAWAAAWPRRTWAIEGARGLGHLLARQLVAAGERVLDVQPKLAAVAWLSVPHRTGCSVAGMRGREPSSRAVYGNGQGLLGNPAVMPRRLPVAAGALWPSPEAPHRCAPWRWLWT